jgi:hypothetical protein
LNFRVRLPYRVDYVQLLNFYFRKNLLKRSQAESHHSYLRDIYTTSIFRGKCLQAPYFRFWSLNSLMQVWRATTSIYQHGQEPHLPPQVCLLLPSLGLQFSGELSTQ